VRDEPVLKFFAVGVTAYGMATFEGPLLSLKNVNAIAHFTDWIVAHVHTGALGWNGLMTFGMFYWMVPKIYGTKLYSKSLANIHFWISTLGILFYAIPMYWSGFAQGMMWKEFLPEGLLKYPNFLETTLQVLPMHVMRSIGGTMFLSGVFIMAYNLIKTAASGKLIANEDAEAPALEKDYVAHGSHSYWHKAFERKPITFMVLTILVILIGGVIEIIPMLTIKSNIPTITSVKPYTPLELQGRDIYIREGCVSCHSQMIRPFRSETERYGEYSKAGEYVYDHPFLWGSKRTGPDLMRVGGKYPDSWHFNHMIEPGSMSPGSIMPSYPWLAENDLNSSNTADKIKAMQTLGVPYEKGYAEKAEADLKVQAEKIAAGLVKEGYPVDANKEIIAMIAYLQRLGTDIKLSKTASK
jgi:cytochrome c oxidase cbb3-type subunit I/II